MNTLAIGVHWLGAGTGTPCYHGAEWPPAPLRLFQALAASAYRHPSRIDRYRDTLEALERWSPPVIYAPRPSPAPAVTSSVPNNDGDLVLDLHAQGKTGEAREKQSKLVTLRERRGRIIEDAVHYVWGAETTSRQVRALQALADGVTHVGQGTDLAWVQVSSGPKLPAPSGSRHEPSRLSGNRLQVPYPGALEALQAFYEAYRSGISGGDVTGTPRPEHAESGYASVASLPLRRAATFRLRTLNGDPWSAGRDGGLAVAAMLRHAIGESAKRAGFDVTAVAELMGHGGPGRIHAMPLPNVGHYRADGRIRRVMIASTAQTPVDHWSAIRRRLAGEVLSGHQGDPVVSLSPETDQITESYTEQAAATWTTATPVILPGWEHRRGRPRPHRTVKRLLMYAGIPEEAVAKVTFEPAGRLAGTARAHDYPAPRHLGRYPRTHLTIQFQDRVRGPLFLGAGVGVGLGLLLPCER